MLFREGNPGLASDLHVGRSGPICFSLGDIPGWPVTSVWGGLLHMLDVCGPPYECSDAPETPSNVAYLWADTCFHNCGKAGIAVAVVGWPLLWAFRLTTKAHLTAEAHIRALQKDLQLKRDL